MKFTLPSAPGDDEVAAVAVEKLDRALLGYLGLNSSLITASHTSAAYIKHVGNIYYLNKYEVTFFEDFAVLD